jgi:cytochrome c oxidase subunit 2
VLPVLLAVGAACAPDAESAPKLSPAAEHGRDVARSSGCVACHGADGEGGVGPRWTGLYPTEVELEDGSTVVADEAYLRRAINDPDADVRAGFAVSMPENDLDADDVDAVVAYIEALGS